MLLKHKPARLSGLTASIRTRASTMSCHRVMTGVSKRMGKDKEKSQHHQKSIQSDVVTSSSTREHRDLPRSRSPCQIQARPHKQLKKFINGDKREKQSCDLRASSNLFIRIYSPENLILQLIMKVQENIGCLLAPNLVCVQQIILITN